MVDIEKLEAVGRLVMAASVEAEYQGLVNVVGYLDAAFADIVGLIVDQRVQDDKRERREAEEAVELSLAGLGLEA